jgi:hypothetical protein
VRILGFLIAAAATAWLLYAGTQLWTFAPPSFLGLSLGQTLTLVAVTIGVGLAMVAVGQRTNGGT